MEHDNYFKLKDEFIPLLPEPERNIYKQFRLVEQEFTKFHGSLIVNGKNAIQETAIRLNMNEQDVKRYVLSASRKLQRMLNDPQST
ncbi:hypothetical protein [Salisediminibacterium selenitireducens]|uniref:Uncharacterized protein n=1 Tax=Bacillus selenitireducens (strain ATCC 700615 / DSM 15326 / MLS10) TaxID=439292 RepID=D6XUK7_BACIE|nr:hypothetical protein [Salisediminibacterium selenitireducens]ADH99493.1 hypothetical protein Bsel_1989 [[Bacillus] selenitireducens MLS10]